MLLSSSTVYKVLKSTIKIDISISKDIEKVIENNMKVFCFNQTGKFFSLKMDEITITPRVRWDLSTNEFIGICYNHKAIVKSFTFDSFLSIYKLNESFKQDINFARETLVITLSNVGIDDNICCAYLLP